MQDHVYITTHVTTTDQKKKNRTLSAMSSRQCPIDVVVNQLFGLRNSPRHRSLSQRTAIQHSREKYLNSPNSPSPRHRAMKRGIYPLNFPQMPLFMDLNVPDISYRGPQFL